MRAYLTRRLLQFLPTFFGVTVITFALVQLAPGDPIALMSEAGEPHAISSEALQQWRRLKGMDQPWLLQYGAWLVRFVQFDFGRSLVDERLVRELIFEALPPTLLLSGSALLLIYAFSVPLGIYSATHRGKRLERVLGTGLFVAYAMPSFWVALLLIFLFAGGEVWTLFPIRGLASDGIENAGLFSRAADLAWHLCLPVVCLTYPALVRTSRYQRSAMLEVLGQDYMRAARAKGLRPRQVIWRHGLRNSLLPVVSLLSVDLPMLLGGSVIVERIFTIRGMGMLAFEAILRRDYPVIMGITAMVALVTMAAVLAGDLALAAVDPRIRYERMTL